MIVKCRNREFDCKQSDLILDNGACYQIITQNYRIGYSNYTPVLSKTTFKKLLKDGYIVLSDSKYRANFREMDLYEFTEKSDDKSNMSLC